MENRKLKAAATIARLVENETDPEVRTALEMAQQLMEKDGNGLLIYLAFAKPTLFFANSSVAHGGIGESVSEVEVQTCDTGSDAIVLGYPIPFTLENAHGIRLRYFDPKQWWMQALYKNKERILTLAANACRYHIEHSKYTSQQMQRKLCHFVPITETNNISLHLNCTNHYESFKEVSPLPFNKRKRAPFSDWYNGKTKCCISNAVASHYAVFHIYRLEDMARLIGAENIPKFLIGYESHNHSNGDIFEFHFKVGFSKTALNKILKGEYPWMKK